MQEVSKAHIHPAVAIRGCNTFKRKDKIVKNSIILNQIVSDKTLIKMPYVLERSDIWKN